MSDILVIDQAAQRYSDRVRALNNLDTTYQSTDTALATNPHTKKVTGMQVALEQLGVEVFYQESMEDGGLRSYLSITAIRTLLVKAVEAIINYIRELIGMSLPLEKSAERCTEVLGDIIEARSERTFIHRLPRFKDDETRDKWYQQWERYKMMIGRIDPSVKEMSIDRFFLEYRIPQGRNLNYLICNSVARVYGVPQCYINGARDECIRSMYDRFTDIVDAVDSLTAVTINEQTGELTYDDINVDSVKSYLTNELSTNWRRVRLSVDDDHTLPDWLDNYRGVDATLLRNFEQRLLMLTTKLRKVSKGSCVEYMVNNHLSTYPDHAQATRTSVNKWLDDVRGVVSSMTTIYSAMRRADAATLDALRLYHRYASKVMEHKDVSRYKVL